MQDVRTTVSEALNASGYGQYAQYAEPVVTALVNRERDICGVLIEYATQQGLSRAQAEQALAQAGMAVPVAAAQSQPPPRPAPAGFPGSVPAPAAASQTEGTGDPVADALRDIQNTLAGLTAFARENGYSG